MDWQHDNLCNSIQRLLSDDGVCLAIAGFHTGRPKVASFFEAVERAGLTFLKPIIERDVMGNDRPWQADRGREDPVERKKYVYLWSTTALETDMSKVAGNRFFDITELSRKTQHVISASTTCAGALVVIINDSVICATCEVHAVDRIPPCLEHIALGGTM